MWNRRQKTDVVAQSLAETLEARKMITESNELLANLERDLTQILSRNALATMTESCRLLETLHRRH